MRPAYKPTVGVTRRLTNGTYRYLEGPFHAELGLGMALRQSNVVVPDEIYAGLLIRGPDPDGYGGVELVASGYTRVPVRLVERSLQRLAVPHPVVFDFEGGDPPTHVAFFSAPESGTLLWYGGLKAWRFVEQPPTRVEFPAYSLEAKRYGPERVFVGRGAAERKAYWQGR